MKCPICNSELSDNLFFGTTHKCDTCSLDFRVIDNAIEGWGINNGDLSLFGDRKENVVKVWRIGSGNDAYLHKEEYKLPNKSLLDLFYRHIRNEIS